MARRSEVDVGDQVEIMCNRCKGNVKAMIIHRTISMKNHWVARGHCSNCREVVANIVKGAWPQEKRSPQYIDIFSGIG
jgi:hypothetical protein